ncbi:hypothetical protein VNI00_014639 [Paramarasmius palmivorus]|uniref:F-box domain-containing protein n=1 Tax=Paramarasmius palmivorus TaxID=297713 RepID=A0AAW0BRG6_9AGAR
MSRFRYADPNIVFEQNYRQMLASMAFAADRARQSTGNSTLGGVYCDRCEKELRTTDHPAPPSEWVHSASTYSPSEPEIAQTLAFVKEEEKDLEALDLELGRLLRQMDNLLATRFALQTRLDKRRNLLSAMRRMPNELWAKVFEEVCLSPYEHNRDDEGYSLMIHNSELRKEVEARPLILSHVSSHFRSIVTNIPRLWASISVNVYGLYHDICPLLNLFIQNSKGVPLYVELADAHLLTQENGTKLALKNKFTRRGKTAVVTLLSEAPRILELKLELAEDWEALSFENPPQITFPILRDFRTFSEDTMESESIDHNSRWFWNAIYSAPNLTSVKTDNFLDVDMVPFAQLTNILIRRLTKTRRLLQLLELSPNVESLDLTFWDTRKVRQVREIACNALKSLTFNNFGHTEGCGSLFDSLTAPALTQLSIRNGRQRRPSGDPFPWDSLKRMIERSSSRLLKLALHLEHDSYVSPGICEVFHVLPDLESLEVHFREGEGEEERATVINAASELIGQLCIAESQEANIPLPKLSKILFKIRPWVSDCPKEIDIMRKYMSQLESSRSVSALEARGLLDRVCPIKDLSVESRW